MGLAGTESVLAPGGFVPQSAVAFGAGGGVATAVDASHPLPVDAVIAPARSAALAGTSSAASGVVGPFTPQLGRSIWVTLAGNWTGSVTVMRSIDGGVTLLPLTAGGAAWASFTGPAQEPVGEEGVAGATWHLAVALTAGTLIYQVAQ